MSDNYQYGEQLGRVINKDIKYKEFVNNIISNPAKYQIYKILAKWGMFKIICCAVLFTFFISLGASIFSIYIRMFIENNSYDFSPEYKGSLIFYRDKIDTIAKLSAVLADPSIDKDSMPILGSLISEDAEGLYIVSEDEIMKEWNLYPLHNIEKYYYENGYKFIPNVLTISKNPILLERVKSRKTIEFLLKTGKISQKHQRIFTIGSYICKISATTYSILENKNVLIQQSL